MSRRKKPKSKNDLTAVNLAIAKVKLTKLKTEARPPEPPKYTRYEDLPPLCPEEQERLKQHFLDLLTIGEEEAKREQYEWYMSMAHLAP